MKRLENFFKKLETISLPKWVGLISFAIAAVLMWIYFTFSEKINEWLDLPADAPGPLGVVGMIGFGLLIVFGVIWLLLALDLIGFKDKDDGPKT